MSDAAEPYLAGAAASADLLAAAARLRKELSASRAHLVLEQTALRTRAHNKFAAAERLFFTSVGLEQATDEWIAAYKARRFAAGRSVVDLCCGIGGDLMALAARGPARGVDRDPVCALLAGVNVERSRTGAIDSAGFVTAGLAELHPPAPEDLWHVDPDRRASGRRTTQVELADPTAETIDHWRKSAPSGAIKLAPATALPPAWSAAGELEWISFARECRQLVVWFGDLARDFRCRRATRVDRKTEAVRSFVGAPDAESASAIAGRVARYVFDPDPAVVASRLTGALAEELQLARLSTGASYLTADQPVSDPLLAAFEVLEVMPLDLRRIKRLLRERGIGKLVVKQRGLAHDPAKVARSLKVPGEHWATLLLARHGRGAIAILAERIATEPSIEETGQEA